MRSKYTSCCYLVSLVSSRIKTKHTFTFYMQEVIQTRVTNGLKLELEWNKTKVRVELS